MPEKKERKKWTPPPEEEKAMEKWMGDKGFVKVEDKVPAVKYKASQECLNLMLRAASIVKTSDSKLAQQLLLIASQGIPVIGTEDVSDLVEMSVRVLESEKPADAVEARLLLQLHTSWSKAFEMLSRAATEKTPAMVDMLYRYSIKFFNLHNATVEALEKYRRKGEQRVSVHYQQVQMADGAQAVIQQNTGGGGHG